MICSVTIILVVVTVVLSSDMFAGATRLRALCSSYLAAPARTALLPFPEIQPVFAASCFIHLRPSYARGHPNLPSAYEPTRGFVRDACLRREPRRTGSLSE